MAIQKNGANGTLSGKYGSVVAYNLNGQEVVRSLPKPRTTGPTERELLNREKFALLQAWLKPIIDVLRVGFKNYSPNFQGFVAAKSYNSKHALKQNEDGSFYVNPALALVSAGTLSLPKDMAMEYQDHTLVITWNNGNSHYDYIDQAIVLAYAPKKQLAEYDIAAGKRGLAKATLILSDDFVKGDEVHVYLAFVAFDHSAQSNSQYLGSFQIS